MDKHYNTRCVVDGFALDEHVKIIGPATFRVAVTRLDNEDDLYFDRWNRRNDCVIPPPPLVKIVMTAYVPLDQIGITSP